MFLELYHARDGTGQRASRSGANGWQAIDGFRSEQWSCPRQPRSKPKRCRPPSQKDRFADGQAPCGVQPVEAGNRRPGAEREVLGASYPASSYRGHDRQWVKSAPQELEGKIATGQLLEKTPADRARGSACGMNLRTWETTRWRTNAESPQNYLKRLLAGCERFSEGVTERRDADLSFTPTFTTVLSRHTLSINNNRTPGRPTCLAVSAREPRCLRFPSARPPGLAALPIRCDICMQYASASLVPERSGGTRAPRA